MGGNVFETNRRLLAKEYKELKFEVFRNLDKIFLYFIHYSEIPYYREKESFGDLDIVIGCHKPMDIIKKLCETFEISSNKIFVNSNTVSFQYKDFQIDLIFSGEEDYQSSLNYFSWNDLGNLMGRIARKAGFKYGHKGLTYVLREGDWQFAEILVSKDQKLILEFLGYDFTRYSQGFDTVEEIYNFTCSSLYFNSDSFLMENLNHINRVRNRKRPVYKKFLEWLKNQDPINIPEFQWSTERKEWFLDKAFRFFPGFSNKFYFESNEFEKVKEFKQKFNGRLVQEITGLDGKELGSFVCYLKKKSIKFDDFQDWILSVEPRQIKEWIEYNFENWEEKR